MLIDPKAAHERILFEKYYNALENAPISSQQKLLPKTIHITAADDKLLAELLPELSALGFDMSSLGKNTYVINGIPSDFDVQDEQGFILDFLEQFKQQAYASFNKHERVARLMAKRVRMNSNKILAHDEMAALVDQLFACKEPQYTPEGKACVRTIKLEDLYGMF